MPKRYLTYHMRSGDSRETQVYRYVFVDDAEVEIAESDFWLWAKLSQNPWFTSRVEGDPQPTDAEIQGIIDHTPPVELMH